MRYRSSPNDWVSLFITAPAHSHATSVAVYPALFLFIREHPSKKKTCYLHVSTFQVIPQVSYFNAFFCSRGVGVGVCVCVGVGLGVGLGVRCE